MLTCLLLLLALLPVSLVNCLPCPLGWLLIGGSCYFTSPEDTHLSWDGARAACVDRQATMLEINSTTKQLDVQQFISGYPFTDWWINIKKNTESSQQWMSGIDWNLFGEEKIEISSNQGSQCAFISSADGLWYWNACEKTKKFICEKSMTRQDTPIINTNRKMPDNSWINTNMKIVYQQLYGHLKNESMTEEKGTAVSPTANTSTHHTTTMGPATSVVTSPTVTPTPNNLCQEEGWMMLDGRCYRLFLDVSNWTMAELSCQYQGGHLAEFSSLDVQTMWKNKYNFHSGSVWIGLHKNLDGRWYWSQNNSLSYLNWIEAGNTADANSLNCGALSLHESKWLKQHCSAFKAFVCYRELLATVNETITTTSSVPTATTPSPCGSADWFLYEGQCYFVNANGARKTFYQAQMDCRKRSSNLVKITNTEINNFILGKIKNGGMWAWIGLYRKNIKTTFSWIDGSSINFNSWGGDQEPTRSDAKCVSMVHESGRWDLTDCNAPLNYVCEKPQNGIATVPPTEDSITRRSCPSGWTLFNRDKCIRVFSAIKTWSSAQRYCKSLAVDSDLISINSALDQAYLTLALKNTSNSLWIGLAHKNRPVGFFSWSDQSSFNYSKWSTGQPMEKCDVCPPICVIVAGGNARDPGKWYTVDCIHPYSYICQQPAHLDNSRHPVVKSCAEPHSDFTEVGGMCYKVLVDQDNWNDANSYCQAQKSGLPYVKDVFTNSALMTFLSDRNESEFWLGLSDQAIYGKMQWTAPWPPSSTFSAWSPDKNNKMGYATCATIDINTGEWNYHSCINYKSYVCMYAPQFVRSQVTDGCPSEQWVHSTTKCFLLSEEGASATWSEGKAACEAKGYELAVVSNENDQLAVRDLTIKLSLESSAWIGLRRQSGAFVWSDNSTTEYKSWKSGEPSTFNCVSANKNSDGHWSSMPCSYYRPYICMAPKTAVAVPSEQTSEKLSSTGWSVFGVICLVLAVVVTVVLLVNVTVKHFFISWRGFLNALPRNVYKSMPHSSTYPSVDNVTYNHQDDRLSTEMADSSIVSAADNNETNFDGSQENLVTP